MLNNEGLVKRAISIFTIAVLLLGGLSVTRTVYAEPGGGGGDLVLCKCDDQMECGESYDCSDLEESPAYTNCGVSAHGYCDGTPRPYSLCNCDGEDYNMWDCTLWSDECGVM